MSDEKKREYLEAAMTADAEIDRLKGLLDQQLKLRSDALGEAQKLGVKRFDWKGTTLVIFKRGEQGLWSLRGKKEDDKNIFSLG